MTQQSQRKSVLVIDDEPQVLGAIADTLEDEFEVMIAASPLTGIRLLKKYPDLSVVISDQRMPEMTGDEFLAKAREISPATRLMITGYADLEAVIRAVNLGQIFGYISKPWNPEHLKLAVLRAAEHCELLKKLETERRLLHNLMDNIPDAIFFKDLEHRYVRVNKVQAARHKISRPEDMIGKTNKDFMLTDHALAFDAEDAEIIRTGTAVVDRIGQADNEAKEFRWYSTTMAPVKDSRGCVVSLVGITRDITERKRAEQLLRLEHMVASSFADAGSESTALKAVIQSICETQGWECGRYLRVDEKAGVLRVSESWHVPDDAIKRFVAAKSQAVFGPGIGLAGCAWQSGQPTWIADIKDDARALGAATTLETRMRGAFHFPVMSEGKTIGVLAFNSRKVHEPDDRLLRTVHTIGSQIGQFVVRMEQRESIVRLNRVYAVLSGINSLIVRVHDRQELFDEACRIAVEHGGFGLAWVGLFDAATLDVTPIAGAGLEAQQYLGNIKSTARADLPQGRGVVGRAIRERQAVFTNDITQESGVGGERRKEAIRRGYRSLIALPLLAGDTVVATMSLFAIEPNFFNDDELKLLNELADDISFALQSIARQEKLEKLSRIRAVSSEINAAIVRIHDRDALLQETCRIVADHGKFGLVWVAALDEEKQEIRPVAWTGFPAEIAHAVNWASMSAGATMLAEVLQTRRPAVRNDSETAEAASILRREALKQGCHSTVCLPLLVDDKVVAAIVLFATGRNFFDASELALLNEVASDISFALQSIARQERLEYLAYYDVLTGLPNRTLFLDRLNQQMHARSSEPRAVALVLLNLERFRMVNETLGRHGGDELLRLVAQRLKHACNGKDNVARVSADGFGIVVSGAPDAVGVAHIVEHEILTCFRDPYAVDGTELRIAAKAGIALFPTDGEDTDTLFKNAEAALKKTRRSSERYLFYAADMNARAAQALSLETRLRTAIEAEQFVLHYQPKIELATGQLCGVEALIRWRDPAESGLVPPARFIPILEETGMILEVGAWAIRKALADYDAWHAQELHPPRIAVNVSQIQLRQKDFVDTVKSAIKESKAMPNSLDLEITESLIMEDVEENIRKLRVVRDLGVDIAIDDFGTGYSSLNYLARLPVNALKIDRSFIITMTKDADNMAIVSTIISLAHSLNLKVIAEGVETEEQAQFLRLLKCNEMQGYLYSKPLPVEQLTKLLAERKDEIELHPSA